MMCGALGWFCDGVYSQHKVPEAVATHPEKRTIVMLGMVFVPPCVTGLREKH